MINEGEIGAKRQQKQRAAFIHNLTTFLLVTSLLAQPLIAATDYRLGWNLDENAGLLNVTISAPAESDRHTNFGMVGADIVAGSDSGGVRTMFAELYTGPPAPSSDLEISSDSFAKYEDGRMTVSFSRPFHSGYLANQLKMEPPQFLTIQMST